MNITELLKRNRSYRSFDPSVKLSFEEVKDLLSSVRFCASSRNLQMLKYRIAVGEDAKRLLPCTHWAGLLKNITLPPVGHEPSAFIVICGDTNVTPAAETFGKDVGIAAQSILLCAVEKGLGGCMLGAFDKAEVQSALCLSSSAVPMLILALGKPEEEITIVDADGSIDYYREGSVHIVPKRTLEDLLL